MRGRPPEEAEVRALREQRWSQWETFTFDNEGRPDKGLAEVDRSAEIHALCDSWLAQRKALQLLGHDKEAPPVSEGR